MAKGDEQTLLIRTDIKAICKGTIVWYTSFKLKHPKRLVYVLIVSYTNQTNHRNDYSLYTSPLGQVKRLKSQITDYHNSFMVDIVRQLIY